MGKFEVGAKVKITGDNAGVGHDFKVGDVGVIVALSTPGYDNIHSGEVHSVENTNEGWDVAEIDLELVKETTVPDAINPKHYSEGMPGGVQVIDIIRAQDADFLHGNVIKYLLRWKFKNGVTDLKKAQQYLVWLLEQEEAKDV